MISIVYGVVAGGAMLGLLWMLLTAPAVFTIRSANGSHFKRRRNARDAWAMAYLAGVLTYVALLASGLIAY